MFKFPSGKYIGEVTAPPEGFGDPQRMCSDDKGNVYVTNTGELTIDVYAHDGTYIRTLSDHGVYPVDCAFDRSTGNLAVSSLLNVSDGPGNIAVYANATGSPTTSTSDSFLHFYFLSYMGKTGILYFDGENYSNKFAYGSLGTG
jgi:hypothetical protein